MNEDLSTLDSQIAILLQEEQDLELKLQRSKEFTKLAVVKKKISDMQDEFRKQAIPYMQEFYKETGKKTSKGVAGKITLVERDYFKVEDQSAVPEEYLSSQPDMDKIKRSVKLFKKDIPGVFHEVRPQVNISWNTEDLSS